MLKALAEIHPRPDWPFPIIVGTSAGAVSAQHPGRQMSRAGISRLANIEQVWANFHVAQVFRSDAIAMLKAGAPLDGFAVHGRHDRPAEIPARQFAAARTAFQGDGFRRHPRERRARRSARAGAVRHQLFHRALGVVLRSRDHHQRMVARAASRRARAAVARLPDGESRHPVPVSADVPARRIFRRRRDAPDRAAEPGDPSRRRSAAGAGRAAHASRPDSALRRVGFTADAGPAVRLHAGHAVQRPDFRRSREPEPHQPAVGAGRRRRRARGRSRR